ncbi:hypothetical protein [Streptomyces spinosirectus]
MLSSGVGENGSTGARDDGDHGRVTSREAAARALQDRAVLWSMGEVRAAEVVAGACDALVAGLDSPALRMLAACTRAEADYDVPDLLPPALDELDLTFYPVGSVGGQEAAARALAARMLAGELTPRELVLRIHHRFGHELPLAERLANLDDEYDILEYGGRTAAQVDADVVAEALRVTEHPLATPHPTDQLI